MRDDSDSSQGGPSPKGSRLKACQGRPLPVQKGEALQCGCAFLKKRFHVKNAMM